MKSTLAFVAALLACFSTAMANAGDQYDLKVHPEAILQDVDHARLNIGGIKIGDGLDSVPSGQVQERSQDGERLLLTGGYVVIIVNNRVKQIGIDASNADAFQKMGMETNEDIELLLGLADRVQDEHGGDYHSYLFLKHRLKVIAHEHPMVILAL